MKWVTINKHYIGRKKVADMNLLIYGHVATLLSVESALIRKHEDYSVKYVHN